MVMPAHSRSRGADPRWHDRGHPLQRLIPARAGRTRAACPHECAPRAHPRSRGADFNGPSGGVESHGSSPLARGGRWCSARGLPRAGLIPARAGRTSMIPSASALHAAHPRSRGADSLPPTESAPRLGSSPLARGGPPRGLPRGRSRGLIPARAGRTRSTRRPSGRASAHPRSRGADLWSDETGLWGTGSSPLARGGPGRDRPRRRRGRLIPARAGRTSTSPT